MTLVAIVATVAAACTGGGGDPSATPSPVPVTIAFLDDGTLPGATGVVTPSLYGVQLALTEAVDRGGLPVDPSIVTMDVEGDPGKAVDLARQIAADPAYVAVVVGPFWSEPPQVGAILDAAGVPTFSLSDLDPSLASRGWSSWRRVVPGLAREAESLAAATRGAHGSASGICVLGDGSAYSDALGDLMRKDLRGDVLGASTVLTDESELPSVMGRIERAGCGSIVWTGFSPGATLLRTGLAASGLARIVLLGSGAMKSDAYLSNTEGASDGTVVTCGCVDLSSSTRPEARRFIHDFQSEYGAPPGVYAAESWDVGGILLRAFRAPASSRRALAAALAAGGTYDGLAGTYRFAADGEVVNAPTPIHLLRAEGLRWVPIGEAAGRPTLPVQTPGYLSVSSCRTGRPFAYTSGGKLRGFDVDLATAVARRLGLTLAWSDRTCGAALAAVAHGTLDAVVAPDSQVPQGTPTSRIALSLHVAIVTERSAAHGSSPALSRLSAGDVVAVVRNPETTAWRRAAQAPEGITLVPVAVRHEAYAGLAAGRFAAVADLEPGAWSAIERLPSLAVAQSIDVGAHDVFVAKGPDTTLIAAVDAALGRVIASGRYGLLFAEYFPGTPVPSETGT